MTHPKPWPAPQTAAIGRQVRYYRDKIDLKAQELAAKMTEVMGSEYTRAQITNLETNRRSTITVGEVIALGAILGVPPAMLVALGDNDADSVELVPGQEVHPWAAYSWFTGTGISDSVLRERDPERFGDTPIEVIRRLNVFRRHDQAVMNLDMDARAPASDDAQAKQLANQVAVVVAIRNEIRAYGWTPPWLPPDVKERVEQAEKETGR